MDKWLELLDTIHQVEINDKWYLTIKDYNKIIEYKNYEFNELAKDIRQLQQENKELYNKINKVINHINKHKELGALNYIEINILLKILKGSDIK